MIMAKNNSKESNRRPKPITAKASVTRNRKRRYDKGGKLK